MSTITNRNTIIKFSKRAWIVPTMANKEAMLRYNNLNKSTGHLDRRDQEAQESIIPLNYNKQVMIEV